MIEKDSPAYQTLSDIWDKKQNILITKLQKSCYECGKPYIKIEIKNNNTYELIGEFECCNCSKTPSWY